MYYSHGISPKTSKSSAHVCRLDFDTLSKRRPENFIVTVGVLLYRQRVQWSNLAPEVRRSGALGAMDSLGNSSSIIENVDH
ncbi:hypothetical protein E4L95_13345 [Paracoccus liaowanqingii]|uniref:Uncharacterized protein n=1 Tax=Paracoccus liaowanqingii TaxID=2560053 RepID=A0A4Z1BU44_9RHOB|nr:hypothetical protein [Paracoccus liaowanqingii]TGN57477.1 hypothetical protein E4L95_13345 [Paracoccus liaowanqingii]